MKYTYGLPDISYTHTKMSSTFIHHFEKTHFPTLNASYIVYSQKHFFCHVTDCQALHKILICNFLAVILYIATEKNPCFFCIKTRTMGTNVGNIVLHSNTYNMYKQVITYGNRTCPQGI